MLKLKIKTLEDALIAKSIIQAFIDHHTEAKEAFTPATTIIKPDVKTQPKKVEDDKVIVSEPKVEDDTKIITPPATKPEAKEDTKVIKPDDKVIVSEPKLVGEINVEELEAFTQLVPMLKYYSDLNRYPKAKVMAFRKYNMEVASKYGSSTGKIANITDLKGAYLAIKEYIKENLIEGK